MITVNYYLIIVASGIGERMQKSIPKQYIKLNNGFSILDQTLKTLLNIKQIKGCIVVTSSKDNLFKKSEFYNHSKLLANATGGKERFNSVMNALKILKPFANDNDWVLIHDAVRPCIQKQEVINLINKLKDHPTGGLLAVKITNTVKKTKKNNTVVKTLNRNNLWQAQTPQMYRFGILLKALKKVIKNNITITDDASAIEYLGLETMIIPALESNIKITTAKDLELANFYLKLQ